MVLFPWINNVPRLDESVLSDNFKQRKEIVDAGLSVDELISILQLKAENIIPNVDWFKKIMKKDSPVIKFGIDPTWSEIHLWHSIPLNIARLIQATWKEITLVIWDFTAKIGDPTGRNMERRVLTDSEIQANYEQYKLQAAKLLNLEKTNVVYNSSMLTDISIQDLTKFFQKVSMNSLLEREDFQKRIKWWLGLSLAEVFYPLLMALDSITLQADLEIGWKDQLLNFHITRDVMGKCWLDPEAFITTPLLPWITWTGEKMSKSLNNYIGLLEAGEDVYWKVMSIPDSLLELYVNNFVDMQEKEKLKIAEAIQANPYIFKKALAYFLSSMISWEQEALLAEQKFTRKFSKRDFKEEDFVPVEVEKWSLIDVLVIGGIVPSKTEARRLISAGAVRLLKNSCDFEKINDLNFNVDGECYLKIWKKQFIKIMVR